MIKRLLILMLLTITAVILTGEPRTAAQTSPRSVVVIMTDDQNVDSLPVMRHLMSFPYGSWINFTNAFTSDSLCCPSRSTFLTGRYGHHHGVKSNNQAGNLNANNTLATWLDGAGYETAIIGKYLNKVTNKQPGWDVWQVGNGKVSVHTAAAVDFLGTVGDEPFFLFLAYQAPHTAAKPSAQYASYPAYVPANSPNFNIAPDANDPQWVRNLPSLSQSTINQWAMERLNSQRELLDIDDGVLAVMDALAANGQLENTLVLFTADNGFSWGNHRYFKKQCVYDECSRVPLFVRFPGAINREETRIVSNVSLAGTILEWAGVTPGLAQDAPSFYGLLDGTAVSWSEDILLERGAGKTYERFVAIRAPGWLYAEYQNGDVELYDMGGEYSAADPYQLNNLAGNPDYVAVQTDMDGRLDALLTD